MQSAKNAQVRSATRNAIEAPAGWIDVQRARTERLQRRFGLPPVRAALVARLAFADNGRRA